MNKNNIGPIIAVAVIGLALLGLFNDGTESNGSFIEPSITEIASEQQSVGENSYKEKTTELGEEQEQSEYYGLVKIQSGFGLGSEDPRKEYITLAATSKLDLALNISQWSLKSTMTGRSIRLGKATSLYYPPNLTEESSILIGPWGKVIVVTGLSPLSVSFRVNSCTGYLNQFNTFSPSLTQICPLAKNENLSSIPHIPKNDNCLDYVDRISRCQIPIRPLTPEFSSECFYFIQDVVNYRGCVDIHRYDSGFYGNEWRVFLDRSESLWKNRREKIELLDELGNMVDTYEKKYRLLAAS